MPSRPHDTGWDFSRVITLIESDNDLGSARLLPRAEAPSPSLTSSGHVESKGIHLGSFAKLWEELGVAHDGPLLAMRPLEAEPEDQTDSDSAPPPPAQPAGPQAVSGNQSCDAGSEKDAQSSQPSGMSKKQRQKARKRAEQKRAEQQRKADAMAEQPNQQKAKDKELHDAPSASPKKQPAQPAPVAAAKQQRTQSRSNVGAKMRPVTPPQESSQDSPSKSPSKTTSLSSALSAPKSIVSPALASRRNSTKAAALGPAFTPLRQPTQCIPSPKRSPVKTHHTTVSTPAQNQPTLPPSQGHACVQSLVSKPTGLVPRTVQPVVVSKTVTQPPVGPPTTPQADRSLPVPCMGPFFTPQMAPAASPVTAQPQTIYTKPPQTLSIRPRVDRHFQFLNQLMREFPEDIPWLLSPMQLSSVKTSAEGIHVFVDSSNIMIGFKDLLREYGAQGCEMSFDSLVLLMERRRPVAKRVYAGSHRESAPLAHVTKLVETSKAIGYENIVNEQVLVTREDSDKKKFFKAVKKVGWIKAAQLQSGSGSGSDEPEMDGTPATPSAPKWVEQGVDEILHLKMCQSIIDSETPTTMVLATGDGAEAEHSDGFLAHVERALRKGWRVELVSWKQQTNGGYRNRKFRAKWGDQFKIFHLDGYIESLIETV